MRKFYISKTIHLKSVHACLAFLPRARHRKKYSEPVSTESSATPLSGAWIVEDRVLPLFSFRVGEKFSNISFQMMASPLPFLGEKYTELYEYLMVDHGLTEVHVMALLPYVAFQVVSLFCLAFYTACDRFGWFSKYKIYRSKAVPKPTFGMMLEAHISFFVGYTIGMIPLLYYSGIALLEYAGYSARPEDLPSVWHTIAYLVGCIFVSETVFYWCHRILHHP